MFEAHSDLEIFRIRLGKALDYEFHEDYIGGYFSEKGPRDVSSDFGVRLSCCINCVPNVLSTACVGWYKRLWHLRQRAPASPHGAVS